MNYSNQDGDRLQDTNWAAALLFAVLVLAAATALRDLGHVFRALQTWAAITTPILGILVVPALFRGRRPSLPAIAASVVFVGFALTVSLAFTAAAVVPQLAGPASLLASVLLPATCTLLLLHAPEYCPASANRLATAFVALILATSFAAVFARHPSPADSTQSSPRKTPPASFNRG